MSARFEEISRSLTPMGEVSLRRRREPSLDVDVYEVKLDDEFLMSSLFTATEVALARLALGRLAGTNLDVVVGGLGLGYTARAVLEEANVRSLVVVEALDAVIEWHQKRLLPFVDLTSDPRCRLVNADFFADVSAGSGFAALSDRFHAVIVDIDHSPSRVLHPSHARFYTAAGLRQLARLMHPGGVFALWSDDAPEATFERAAEEAFGSCTSHVVTFPNPYTDGEASATVYVAGP